MGVVVSRPEEVFGRLVDTYGWCPGDRETPCGEGSFLAAVRPIVEVMPKWFREYGIRSVVDVGCGDFHWMRDVSFDGMEYDGYDLLPKFVDGLRETHGRQNVRFHQANALEVDLPQADLCICKDVINHYPVSDGLRIMEKIKASSRYFAAIAFPGNQDKDGDIPLGKYWYIDFAIPPFNLGAPIASVDANETRSPKRVFSIWRLP